MEYQPFSRFPRTYPRNPTQQPNSQHIKVPSRAFVAHPEAEGLSADFDKKYNFNYNSPKRQIIITPLSKIVSFSKKMNVWICNTCSISSKTDNSARRKDYLINLIKGAWPDIVILLETNHSNDPNILCEYYDNFFTSPNINKGVIILTKKLL